MKKLIPVLGLALVLLPLAAPAFPQGKKGEEATVRSVTGLVSDASGKPVAGAVVELKNTKTLQIRSYITKDDGSYSFYGLSTNVDYELKAKAGDAASDVKTLSVFDSRSKAVINLKLNK